MKLFELESSLSDFNTIYGGNLARKFADFAKDGDIEVITTILAPFFLASIAISIANGFLPELDIKTNTYGCGCQYGSGLGGCNPKTIITRQEYLKGQKFIIINLGGDIDTPYIIGVV